MEGGMAKRPDEIVAENIAKEFKNLSLIQEDEISDFVQKLSNGNLSIEDWKLMAELIIEEEGAENGQED